MASEAGDSQHKRSKSAAALALLRRKERGGDDDTASEEGSSSQAPTATSQYQQSPSHGPGHGPRLSVASPAMSRVPSNQQPGANPALKSSSSLFDKGHTLEQSVRKFRIVEALRKGDTASISKAIRETSDKAPRASTSSVTTLSATGLDDTTVLHLAIQCAEIPVVEYIVSDGNGWIDYNAKDKDGNTPLHVAAQHGRTQIVRLLLDQKDINDGVPNNAGRLPIDLARNPEIFQLLQLSRSLFADSKVKEIQEIIARRDYKTLAQVLEETRLKQVLDINSTEFASDPITVQSGGTLLHEAARRKDSALIQALLLHGADPFRRDRKGKLPQDVTKDDVTRAMLKRSPAAVAAQRGIQEKAVLGAAAQGGAAAAAGDPTAGRESREMKGYLKKWTNYRKGYQLRWFVLEDGVLSYYKHQDDSGSACRGAINMRIAKLHMSPDEKTKFEIIGKSSVKYTLKANHEVEAKRWFWALNNSIQWTKDQLKEEERQKVRNAELLTVAKAGHSQAGSISEAPSENVSIAEGRRSSVQLSRMHSAAKSASRVPEAESTVGSVYGEDNGDFDEHKSRRDDANTMADDDDDDDEFGDASSGREASPAATKDAFNITAQSTKLQLEMMSQVTSALIVEATRNPGLTLSDPKMSQALSTYDAAIRSLNGLIGDLTRISRDRDAFWQYRLDREVDLRRMWEDSMAQVAREQEVLEARVGEAEEKKKVARRLLKEVVGSGVLEERPGSAAPEPSSQGQADAPASQTKADVDFGPQSPALSIQRRQTVIDQVAELSDSESDDEEFFDAVDAGDVKVENKLPMNDTLVDLSVTGPSKKDLVAVRSVDITKSYSGYENGIRKRLKMDADERPKVSLWGILKSMIGKDMTKMTLPVSFNEPTSLLYRAGEDLEYADLLDLAAERSDSIERLVYVSAFAASIYASTIGRIAKPFNPLLGETFEYVRPDKGYRMFIEQISHHPPVGAMWAEHENWTYWGELAVKSKFYGKSFDINPLGTWFLRLKPKDGGPEDFYTWKKLTCSVIGIITGNPTMDNYGPMEVRNHTTGEVCNFDFKPRGWSKASAYQFNGKISDNTGRTRISLGGRWNSKLYARITPGYEATIEEGVKADAGDDRASIHRGSMSDQNKAFLIWQANERPKGIPFNLTPYVLTFNHIDDKLKPWLAPTDSRLRPDQRAMEDGEYDFAASEKNRLEENQRARRKIREANGEDFVPAWFSEARCEVTGEKYWKFNGEYWQRRERAGPGGDGKVWEGLEPIFD